MSIFGSRKMFEYKIVESMNIFEGGTASESTTVATFESTVGIQNYANELGKDGWELVSAVPSSAVFVGQEDESEIEYTTTTLYFKRLL